MVGVGLAATVLHSVRNHTSIDPQYAWLLLIIAGAMAGFVTGIAQALALKHLAICGACWVLATTLGAAVFAGGVLAFSPRGFILQATLVAFGGLLVGTLQWNSTAQRFPIGWIWRTILALSVAVALPEFHILSGVLIGGLWGVLTLNTVDRVQK